MMTDDIRASLEVEEQSEFHKRILGDCRSLLTLSRRKMKEYWTQWDANDDVYRGLRPRDNSDIAAGERGEPEKMVVPISYSQIQTFVAFIYSLYTQRERFYELTPFTKEDDHAARVGESLLARDLDHNQWEAKLQQFLLDIGRFGIGVMKVTWTKETQEVMEKITTPGVSLGGVQGPEQVTEVPSEVVSYQGNKIINISPYKFFPDVRLPIVRYQEGEFIASDDIYTFSTLKTMEKNGELAGVDFIKPLSRDLSIDRTYRWDDGLEMGGALMPGAGVRADGQIRRTIIITEVQRNIIPNQYFIEGDVPLGPEDYPKKYVIRIANDNRIVSVEPFDYAHNQFTYIVAPFGFDNNVLLPGGLADVISKLQDVTTWFINSRIESVRKVLSNYLVVNPKYVNMDDLKQRKPIIRLLESAPGDLTRVIKQLDLQDVTQSHIADSKYLQELIQIVTGINDTILGQFQPGHRSATEHRNVAAGSAARLRVIASIIWTFAMKTMGTQMLSNLRDGLDEQAYVKLMGQLGAETPEFIQVTKDDLIGHYGFEVFDGTLPSEKLYTSQALMELVQVLIANPMAGAILGYDPKKLLNEALRCRGVTNPERFLLDPVEQQQQQMQLAQQHAMLKPPSQNGNGKPAPAGPGGPGGPAPRIPSSLSEPLLSSLTSLASGGGTAGTQ